jgi:NTE family protein
MVGSGMKFAENLAGSEIAIVFSGGLGLGSYHAGAFEALARSSVMPKWVAGSSAGSIAAALDGGKC